MKILVHLHLFYQDMLPEMLTLLRSLDGYEYDPVSYTHLTLPTNREV